VRVLVTNAEERSVVAACRCLDRAGYEVTAVSGTRPAAAHWSRSVARRLSLPDARDDAGAFLAGLEAELGARPYAALIAATDPALAAVAHGRERLDALTTTGLPGADAVARSLDRLALVDAARAAGLDTPPTRACTDLAEAAGCAEAFGWPVLLKARRPAAYEDGVVVQSPPARPAADATELAEMLPRYGTPVLIQRAGTGPVHSFAGVMAGGRLLAFVASRYVRTWPPSAGSVAFSETVAPDPELRTRTETLVREIGWEGIFELEAIRGEDGGFAAIDFNPRPYGSMALAGAAGAPLASVWVDWLTGRNPAPVLGRGGVRYRWEDADMRNVAHCARRGRLGAAARILWPRRGTTHPFFRVRDPGPFFARLATIVKDRR
jgi:predicted ATP-grasp superfamily ATP-dependent carboligase